MGISIDPARFLIEARQQDVRFTCTGTLGRQDMWVTPERLERLLRQGGLWDAATDPTGFRRDYASAASRFEFFAAQLGASSVTACDASAYEGATLIHDLNQPIGPEHEQRFDVLIDGGTLEHVFNVPVALANCMRMVKTGGHLILVTPTNNYCGHGFYQFSPELLYRVLAPENGFEVQRMVAIVDSEGLGSVFGIPYPFPIRGRRYSVVDPQQIRDRVVLTNADPVLLCVQARKTSHCMPFQRTPQQSDYVGQWQQGAAVRPTQLPTPSSPGLGGLVRRLFSEHVCREWLPHLALLLDPLRNTRFRRRLSFANRRFFKPVD